ncbi:lantibiotic dehydratase [Hathewaya massiliensis]|uniref:lantibiotic dehydratase n=1 Tax=Hathewaya massiliensis TaxID=1964382 RepID=UPI00115B8661|nr:lantibiotic dehydratase [Hathewaya massiliensis]
MDYKKYENPIVLFRGSQVTKEWYNQIKVNYENLNKNLDEIYKLGNEIELKREMLTEKIESIFAIAKENYLLNLKRDIYNKRIEKINNSLKKIQDDELKIDVELFNNLLRNKESLFVSFQNEFENIYNLDREILKESITNEDILKSIIFFNEKIYEKLDKFINQPTKAHNSKLRKIDYFLLKMLIRTSMKTSPFSYLTKTGIVSEDDSEQIPKEAYVEINHALILEILHKFLRNDETALKVLPIKIDSFGTRDSKIYYVNQNSVKQSHKIFETSDKFVEFKLEPSVIEYLNNNKSKVIYYEEFYNELKKINAYEDNEFSLFKQLVNLKLFKQVIEIPNNRDYLKCIVEFLNKNNIGESFIDKLVELDNEIEFFRTNNYKDRIRNWNNIKKIIKNLSEEEIEINNEMIYEDIVFNSSKNNLIKGKVDEEYLNTMADFILLFDVNIRVQYELAKRFYNKYKDEEIKLSNSAMLNEVFFSNIHSFYPYYQDQYYCYNEALSEEVYLLDKLRLEFLNEFNALINNSSESEEVDVKDIILKYCSLIPSYIKDNANISYTLFAQATGGNKVVVNDVYDGQEKFISRFKDFFKASQNTEAYVDYINKGYNQNNYYEINELFGFNGGIHERNSHKVANLNIGYEQFVNKNAVSLSDFSVLYNAITKKLDFMDDEKKDFKVIYKSSLVPIFLPGILSIMLYMFQSGRLNFNISSLFKEKARVPRIVFNNMIISRKKWNIDVKDLNNLFNNNEPISVQYKLTREYFKEKGLPLCFFLKHYRQGKELSVEKPMFFDLNSPLFFKFLVNEMGSIISSDKKIYFEEVMPEISYELNEYLVEYTFDKKGAIKYA